MNMPNPSTTGTEMAFTVNARNGKLTPVWTHGDIAFDDTMKETVMSLLFENEGPFTTNRRRGPGPMSVATDTADAPSLIKARAEERLQIAIDDGRLRSAAVTCERKDRGKLALAIAYVTRAGKQDLLEIPIGA